jgi:hypothetical protein
MSSTPAGHHVTVSLSHDEYALVETATRIGRYATLDTFAHHAVMEAAQAGLQPGVEIPAYLREEDAPSTSPKAIAPIKYPRGGRGKKAS